MIRLVVSPYWDHDLAPRRFKIEQPTPKDLTVAVRVDTGGDDLEEPDRWLRASFNYDALRNHSLASGDDHWLIGPWPYQLTTAIPPLTVRHRDYEKAQGVSPLSLNTFAVLRLASYATSFDNCKLGLYCRPDYVIEEPQNAQVTVWPKNQEVTTWCGFQAVSAPTLISGPVEMQFAFDCGFPMEVFFRSTRGKITPASMVSIGQISFQFDPDDMVTGEQATITVALKWDSLTYSMVTTRL